MKAKFKCLVEDLISFVLSEDCLPNDDQMPESLLDDLQLFAHLCNGNRTNPDLDKITPLLSKNWCTSTLHSFLRNKPYIWTHKVALVCGQIIAASLGNQLPDYIYVPELITLPELQPKNRLRTVPNKPLETILYFVLLRIKENEINELSLEAAIIHYQSKYSLV